MEPEMHLQEYQMEPTHENWLVCYRLALDFGPAVAMQVIENLDARQAIDVRHRQLTVIPESGIS